MSQSHKAPRARYLYDVLFEIVVRLVVLVQH